mgnify:CR=1 FL=1
MLVEAARVLAVPHQFVHHAFLRSHRTADKSAKLFTDQSARKLSRVNIAQGVKDLMVKIGKQGVGLMLTGFPFECGVVGVKRLAMAQEWWIPEEVASWPLERSFP